MDLISKRKFLTIIIPAYNCRNYIIRLLDSIVSQDNCIVEEVPWSNEDLRVVIVDDNSTDNFMELVEDYKSRLDIYYMKTNPRDIHCPGNTRLDGLNKVKELDSEWITFIDNDDELEEMALVKFKKSVIDTGCKGVICGDIRQYDYEENKYILEYKRPETWLHGKFYYLDFLRKYNINFKENLEANEDAYFNALVLGHLIGNDQDYIYTDDWFYIWSHNMQSLSRSFFNEKYFYTEVYYKEYLVAICEPNLQLIKEYPLALDFYVNQIMMCILYGYFYFQGCTWRIGYDDKVESMYQEITAVVKDICNTLKVPKEYLVNYIYNLPERYMNLKKKSWQSCGSFVEEISFKDFILNMNI